MVYIPLILIFGNIPIRFLVGKAGCEILILNRYEGTDMNRNNKEEWL